MTDTTLHGGDRLQQAFDNMFGIPFAAFLRSHWPDKFLVCEGDVARLAEVADLPELATAASLFHAYGKVNDDQHAISLVDFDREGRKRSRACDVRTARSEYEVASDSRSVLFSQLESYVEGVQRCKTRFEQLVGVRASECTAYAVLSRPGKGFPLHFDNQSVINIQLRGRKRWIVDKTPVVANPLSTHSVGVPLNAMQRRYWPSGASNDSAYDPPDVHDFVMAPGTVSFVPRGHWHRTVALDESISLVLTYAGSPCLDVLLEHLRSNLVCQDAWRAPLIGGYIGPPNELTERTNQQLRELIRRWALDSHDLVTIDALTPKPPNELRSLDDVMARMRETFDARQSAGVNLSFQFCVEGNRAADFHATVRDGAVRIAKGKTERADLTITAGTSDLIKLVGDIGRGLELYSAGRLSMDPLDLSLAARLPKLFRVFEGA